MALAKANCLYPEIDRNIRFFGSDSESILQYLISINVPYEVFEHLDIKMPNVENTLSEAEVINLVNKHKIELKCIGHNTKVSGPNKYGGIITRANFDSKYTDVSPSFNFETFNKYLKNE